MSKAHNHAQVRLIVDITGYPRASVDSSTQAYKTEKLILDVQSAKEGGGR